MSPTILAFAAKTGGLSPRWEATLRAFYGLELRPTDAENLSASTHRGPGPHRLGPMRELWCRVGRRGRKSSTAALVALFEAVYGGHERFLMAGERGLVAVISKDIAGSTVVARFVETHASALGLETNWTSVGAVRVLELTGIPFGIACFPCSSTAPRGWAMPVVIADEIAHWAVDSTQYENSDTDVLAAVKPGMLQFGKSAKLIAISTPLGTSGVHYETVEANLTGSDPNVLAVQGASWEWNPSLSEADARSLEKDPAAFSREYLAVPAESVSPAFILEDLDRAIGGNVVGEVSEHWMTSDPATLTGKDTWAFAWGWKTTHGEIVVAEVDGFLEGTTAETVHTLAAIAKKLNVSELWADSYLAGPIAELFVPYGVRWKNQTWTETSKSKALARLRQLLRDRKLIIAPGCTRLIREMKTLKTRLLASGRTSLSTNGLDHISCLLALGHEIEDPDSYFLSGSTFGPATKPLQDPAELERIRVLSQTGLDWRNRVENESIDARAQWHRGAARVARELQYAADRQASSRGRSALHLPERPGILSMGSR